MNKGAEEPEAVARKENEPVDLHAERSQNLDLPDDVELDNMDDQDPEQASSGSDIDGVSDISEVEEEKHSEGSPEGKW